MHIRPIEKRDNKAVANIIRDVLAEFDCVGEGYSSGDPEVDHMFESYAGDRSAFFVVVDGDHVLGCGGVASLAGAARDVCELRKMYFHALLRGRGFGRKLLRHCLDSAIALGFRTCYLETVARMRAANALYQASGFTQLSAPMGQTGHTPCDAWYVLDLSVPPRLPSLGDE